MTNNSTTTLNSDFIYFDVLNANNAARYISLAYSIATFIITTPMLYSLIQLELNCHNRILINRLIASNWLSGFMCNITVQMLTIVRYLYGPFPTILCDLDYILKNVFVLKVVVFINVSLIVRYIFVFHSKNPTAYQDDFWIFYLNIWAYSFATVCQVITLYFPGKNQMMYYYCLGKMPSALLNAKIKPNSSFTALVLLTFITSFVVQSNFWLFKRGRKKTNVSCQTKIVVPFHQQMQGNFIKLFSFRVHVLLMASVIMSGICPSKINSTDPMNINVFPNYLWVYMHHNITLQTFETLCIIIYLKKHTKLRNNFKMKCLSILSYCKLLIERIKAYLEG